MLTYAGQAYETAVDVAAAVIVGYLSALRDPLTVLSMLDDRQLYRTVSRRLDAPWWCYPHRHVFGTWTHMLVPGSGGRRVGCNTLVWLFAHLPDGQKLAAAGLARKQYLQNADHSL